MNGQEKQEQSKTLVDKRKSNEFVSKTLVAGEVGIIVDLLREHITAYRRADFFKAFHLEVELMHFLEHIFEFELVEYFSQGDKK